MIYAATVGEAESVDVSADGAFDEGCAGVGDGLELVHEDSPSMPYGRRLARVVAVQALYESDMTNRPAVQCLGWLVDEFRVKASGRRFAEELVSAVESDRDSLDSQIDERATWSSGEASEVVLRNGLRVAFAELAGVGDAPQAVAINEAVEVAKLLSNDGGGKFVNGVLGAAVRGQVA